MSNNYNANKNFQDVMQMYRFVDTTSKHSPIRASLPENRVRVHKKPNYNVVVFSTLLYDEFIKDGIKNHCALRRISTPATSPLY